MARLVGNKEKKPVAAEKSSAPPCRSHIPFQVRARTSRALAVRRLALALLETHGLVDWSFRFNRHKQSMGYCRYGDRLIELSIYFVEHNDGVEIRDTLLHEIAHALVGPGHGHDRHWKQKCLEIGARPNRCGRAWMPEGRWQAQCGGCGTRFHRHRRPKHLRSWFCRACGPEQGKLIWKCP
jgi:predicted SprT family Zn-dependent metalloprotease